MSDFEETNETEVQIDTVETTNNIEVSEEKDTEKWQEIQNKLAVMETSLQTLLNNQLKLMEKSAEKPQPETPQPEVNNPLNSPSPTETVTFQMEKGSADVRVKTRKPRKRSLKARRQK